MQLKNPFYQLNLDHKMAPYVNTAQLDAWLHAAVISRLDYCNALWIGLPLTINLKIPTGLKCHGLASSGS